MCEPCGTMLFSRSMEPMCGYCRRPVTRRTVCVLWREPPSSPATPFSGEARRWWRTPMGDSRITSRVCRRSLTNVEHEIATCFLVTAPLDDPDGVVEAYLQHRHARLDEISAVMKAGASTVEEIVDRVYADLPVEVRPAAIATVRAQTEFLDNA